MARTTTAILATTRTLTSSHSAASRTELTHRTSILCSTTRARLSRRLQKAVMLTRAVRVSTRKRDLIVYDKIAYTYYRKANWATFLFGFGGNTVVVENSEIWMKNLKTGETTLLGNGYSPCFRLTERA